MANSKSYAAVCLVTEPLKNIAIPTKWICNIRTENYLKDGVNQGDWNVVFYSPNEDAADFSLNQRTVFEATEAGCYTGHIYQFFGTGELFCTHFLASQVVYFHL